MKKRGRPFKKEKPMPVKESSAPVVPETDDMTDAEVQAMIDEKAEKKKEAKEKVELSVDAQEWTATDPVIPEDLEGLVWIAVFKCPTGDKTKATNRQAVSGVKCWKCGEKAEIMPQFLKAPQKEKARKP